MSRPQNNSLLWDQSWLPLHWENRVFLWQQKAEKKSSKHFRYMRSTRLGQVIHSGGGVLCSILSMNKNVEKMEWEEIKKCAVLGNAVAGLCVQREVESLRFRRKKQCLNLCRNNECI